MTSESMKLPLSFGQGQLWFLEQLAPGRSDYHSTDAVRIRGELDPGRLECALGALVERHDSLRTRFMVIEGQPFQTIESRVKVELLRWVAGGESAEERESAARDRISSFSREPIDLARAPLWRVQLIEIGPSEYWMVLVIHHILFDGWSCGLFWEGLMEAYQSHGGDRDGIDTGSDLQLADFIRWERDHLQGAVLDDLLSYWKEKLGGTLPVMELPMDFARPAEASHRGGKRSLALPARLATRLRELAREAQTTLFITLLAAYKVFLYRYTNQEDLVVGTPFATRSWPGHETIFGFLVNTLVLRSRVREESSFRDFLAEVRATAVEAYDHGELPFNLLVEALQPERTASGNPLFQTMFQMNGRQEISGGGAGISLDPLVLDGEFSNFDLTLEVLETGGGLMLRMEYASDLFLPATIDRMLHNYLFLLEEIGADPTRPIAELRCVCADEANTLLEVWSREASGGNFRGAIDLSLSLRTLPDGVRAEVVQHGERLSKQTLLAALEKCVVGLRESGGVSSDGGRRQSWSLSDSASSYSVDAPVHCLHTYIEAQAARNPDRIAVSHQDRALTYGELNAAANQLAHELIGRGVRPDMPVGICLRRCPEMVVALLAILKAGGAYLPLDPGYPPERLKFKVDDANIRVLVTDLELHEKLALPVSVVLCVDRDGPEWAGLSRENPVVDLDLSNLAYFIYTSGSSGRPKGVMIEHRAVSHFVQAAIQHYGISSEDCMLQFGSISFDLAVEEIFTCLVAGGRLQLRDEDMMGSSSLFMRRCQEWGVTILDLPTAYWHQLVADLEQGDLRFPKEVRLVIIGGERVLPGAVQAWLRKVGGRPRLFNSYGPTETTVVATGYWIDDDLPSRSQVPIGKPLANTEIYVLDGRKRLVPIGAEGELYIGGQSVSRGYLNRPELTAACFVEDPFRAGSGRKLYKTGDRVRFLQDGSLEFLGRIDTQVKIRGFRIEPGEIETMLLRCSDVREAVVLALADSSGGHLLTAYVVPSKERPVAPRELTGFLKKSLPGYMVPAALVLLERLPLTPNGKIDTRALPAPLPSDMTAESQDVSRTGPNNPLEEKLARIWAEVLGLPNVGIGDRFFDLGGHSLQAFRMLTMIREQLEVEIQLSALFQAPSVAEMAVLLAQKGVEVPWSPLVPFQGQGTRLPFFAIHGGHGEVLFYKGLAEHLGPDQPFYALRARGNDFPDNPHRTVEEMAADYIRAIRSIQPDGPYRIGGASFGGIVAFEMAKQLQESGLAVERLILFDTGGFREFLTPLPLGRRVLNLLRYLPRYGLREVWHRLKIRILRFFVSESVVEFYRATGTLPKESSAIIFTWQAVWQANLEAADRYVPTVYPGELTLIRAVDDGNYMWYRYDSDYGWGELSEGGVVGYDVPGTHIGMFQEPYVKRLAETMEVLLSGATQQRVGGGAVR